MNVRRLLVPMVALVALGLIAPGATAAVRYKTSKAYFTCAEDLPVQNVAVIAMESDPSWSRAKPGSFEDGAACGQYANLGSHLYFAGTQKGPFDSITVELHDLYVSRSRGHLLPMPLDVGISIDGRERAWAPAVEIAPVASENGLTEVIRFTITGLKVKGKGTHRITLGVTSSWEQQHMWVWGASEIPSGLTFNPKRPASVRIAAQ